MSKIRKISTVILSVVIVLSYLTLPISAVLNTNQTLVQPRYTNASSVSVKLSKSNGKIVIKITVVGYSGTTFSNGNVSLYKTSGSNTGLVKSWTRLSSSSSIYIFSDNSTTAESGSYTVYFSIKAVRNGVVESISTSDTV